MHSSDPVVQLFRHDQKPHHVVIRISWEGTNYDRTFNLLSLLKPNDTEKQVLGTLMVLGRRDAEKLQNQKSWIAAACTIQHTIIIEGEHISLKLTGLSREQVRWIWRHKGTDHPESLSLDSFAAFIDMFDAHGVTTTGWKVLTELTETHVRRKLFASSVVIVALAEEILKGLPVYGRPPTIQVPFMQTVEASLPPGWQPVI